MEEYINKENLGIFFDITHPEYGQAWRGSIDDALDDSKIFLALLSKNYFSSPICLWECNRFLQLRKGCKEKILIPVLFQSRKITSFSQTDIYKELYKLQILEYQDHNLDLVDVQHYSTRDPRIDKVMREFAINLRKILGGGLN